ncbi:MAG TPA: mechanosensitive ion channel family protein [Steroidobacteraceae bacterium]|jgi:small conductance mechanosensitive channel|nr:mechanosensitive ion channel family protein [Steroidobacteraceae bacterium]
MDEPLENILDTPDVAARLAVQYGPSLLSAALILLAGYFVARWTARFAAGGLRRFPIEPPVHDLILRTLKVLVFLLFALMALQNLGIDLLPLIAGLGIVGAGIALALQGVLGNVAAGLTIIFTRPFRIGEYISIAGEEGVVQKITLFSTTLRHSDLSQVVIPNRKIAGEILHNYGEIRQLDLGVQVAYATNLETAVSTVRDVLAANPRVLANPAPMVQAASLGEYAIRIAIRPWVAVKDFGAAPGEINPAVVRALDTAGIEIAVPMHVVRTTPFATK